MICFPTTYASTNFRSRLEARWAAFFDLCAWRWEYEPIDTAGWMPDFLLIGAKRVVKVEVKPIEWCGEDSDRIVAQATAEPDLAKVRAFIRGRDDEILILGAYPHFLRREQTAGFGSILGAFIVRESGLEEKPHFDLAVLAGGYPPPILDFHAFSGSYEYRIGGEYEGDGHLRVCDPATVTQIWRQAGNAVQWRPDNLPTPIVRPKWSLDE
jgi:hypothetical protein